MNLLIELRRFIFRYKQGFLLAHRALISYTDNFPDFTFEFDSNGKVQKSVKRNVAVIPAFVRKSLCEKLCKSPSFQGKDDVIYQIGKRHFCCIYFSFANRFVSLFLIFLTYLYHQPPLIWYIIEIPYYYSIFLKTWPKDLLKR